MRDRPQLLFWMQLRPVMPSDGGLTAKAAVFGKTCDGEHSSVIYALLMGESQQVWRPETVQNASEAGRRSYITQNSVSHSLLRLIQS